MSCQNVRQLKKTKESGGGGDERDEDKELKADAEAQTDSKTADRITENYISQHRTVWNDDFDFSVKIRA